MAFFTWVPLDCRRNQDQSMPSTPIPRTWASCYGATASSPLLSCLQSGVKKWPSKTLIYLDPPYYVKGRDLYHDFYKPKDHARVAKFVRSGITKQRWIVSYDNAPAIRELYKGSPHIA